MSAVIVLLVAAFALPAQSPEPVRCNGALRRDQLETLVRAGVAANRLRLYIRDCKLDFAITDENLAFLRQIGATDAVMEAVLERNTATLILSADADSSVQVDEYAVFNIAAHVPVRVRVSAGEHVVSAYSMRLRADWRQGLSVGASDVAEVRIVLAPSRPQAAANPRIVEPPVREKVPASASQPTSTGWPVREAMLSRRDLRPHVPDHKAMAKFNAGQQALQAEYVGYSEIQRAQAYHEEATTLDPLLAEAWAGRATVSIALWSRGADSELIHAALEYCERALQVNPAVAAAWNARGVIREVTVYQTRYDLREQQRLDALSNYTEAVRLDPKWAVPRTNRARMLLAAKRQREAVQEADTAIRLDPKSAVGFGVRADAQRALGDYEAASASDAVRLWTHPKRRSVDAMLW